jgi:predicted dinucleotide-binding enzyme
MRIGVLGTGQVGQTLATKLVELGHEVRMGSRAAGNEKAVAWASEAGEGASEGSFADAAEFGELVINATSGAFSLEVLAAAGADNLAGKVLLDVSNPLDFSRGRPPVLAFCNDDSVGERLQRDFPDTRVVKSLNTVNCKVMVDPGPVGGTMFVSGNDADAKAMVTDLLESFGWPRADILDLGDIKAARGQEMYVPLWLRLTSAAGPGGINIKLVTG